MLGSFLIGTGLLAYALFAAVKYVRAARQGGCGGCPFRGEDCPHACGKAAGRPPCPREDKK